MYVSVVPRTLKGLLIVAIQERGYSFDVEGRQITIFGTLSVISADNLGSLAIGGFKESCTAYRCCRHCMATQDSARTKVC